MKAVEMESSPNQILTAQASPLDYLKLKFQRKIAPVIWADSKNMPKSAEGFWHKCTKQDVCERKPYGKEGWLPSYVKANHSDPEYLDNWV